MKLITNLQSALYEGRLTGTHFMLHASNHYLSTAVDEFQKRLDPCTNNGDEVNRVAQFLFKVGILGVQTLVCTNGEFIMDIECDNPFLKQAFKMKREKQKNSKEVIPYQSMHDYLVSYMEGEACSKERMPFVKTIKHEIQDWTDFWLLYSHVLANSVPLIGPLLLDMEKYFLMLERESSGIASPQFFRECRMSCSDFFKGILNIRTEDSPEVLEIKGKITSRMKKVVANHVQPIGCKRSILKRLVDLIS